METMETIDIYARWSKLKPNLQTAITEKDYNNIFINFLVNIIKLKGFPDSVDTRNLVLYGLLFGAYGIDDETKTALYATPNGKIDTNGNFNGVVLGSLYDETIKKCVSGVDCVIGYNNNLRMPDYNIQRYAYMFTQLDVSLMANIKYSRLNKIFCAVDERAKNILTTALKEADNGNNAIITDINFIKNALLNRGNTIDPITSIDLTDVKDVDKIQYINNAHLDLLKRFLWLYGLSMNLSPKMAQQTVDEISNADSGTTVLVDDMLENYQTFCNKCNARYGWNTYAELGNAWENKHKSLNMSSDKDGDEYDDNIDEDTDDNDEERGDNEN